MQFHHFRLALRRFLRNPLTTGINVLGLSIGIATFYILWPYTQAELHTDRFHKDYENIARVSWHHRWTDNHQTWEEMYHPLNAAHAVNRIVSEFSEIKEITRVVPQSHFLISDQGIGPKVYFSTLINGTRQLFPEKQVAVADPNFFTFFSFPLVYGAAEHVLETKGSAVISEGQRRKYFGDKNPLNEVLYLNDSVPYTVTGVFKDLPNDTHFKFDILLSTAGMKSLDQATHSGMFSWLCLNYIRISAGTNVDALEKAINARRQKIYGRCDGCDPSVFLQSLKNIAFEDVLENPFRYKSRTTLMVLRALAFVVLGLAWINYLCLSVTLLHQRLPEMGVRRVSGAGNRDLTRQFFAEALLINLMACLLAVTVVQLVRVPITVLLHFYIPHWANMSAITTVTLVVVLIAGVVVTGMYPAIVSASKRPVDLLKKLRNVQMPGWINAMVTGQYAATVVLFIWMAAIYLQVDHLIHLNIGLAREGIATIEYPLNQSDASRMGSYIEELRKLPGVVQVSTSLSVAGDDPNFPTFLYRNASAIGIAVFSNGGVDEHYIGLYDISMLAGRNFQADNPADRRAVLISRNTSKRLGFSEDQDAIGATIGLSQGRENDAVIIGVYADYMFRPFFEQHQKVGAGSVLTYKNYLIPTLYPSKVSVLFDIKHLTETTAGVEKLYRKMFPNDVFRMTFLDDNVTRHYAIEEISRNQVMLFTILSVGIACLGLLGTISNKVIQKTKEIGIRKVLGAGVAHIASMLMRTTIRQIVIASVVGIPIAYFLSEQYFNKFSERIELNWWHFVAPVSALVFVMMATVAFVLLNATRANPVEALKHE